MSKSNKVINLISSCSWLVGLVLLFCGLHRLHFGGTLMCLVFFPRVKTKPRQCISAVLPKMPTAGPPGDSILQQRDPSDPICSSSAPAPVLQKGMPGSASKQKKVIDPTEEKEEPEARDRDTNWKNAMFMLLPKSIVPARSCCGCRALC